VYAWFLPRNDSRGSTNALKKYFKMPNLINRFLKDFRKEGEDMVWLLCAHSAYDPTCPSISLYTLSVGLVMPLLL